jgi:hypothetical protein
VSHYGLAIYIKKKVFKGKRRTMIKLKHFTMQKYNLFIKKIPLKETKNPSR